MRSIRFSDQVLSNEDVSLTAASAPPAGNGSRRQSYASSNSNGGYGGSIQLSDLGGPTSNAHRPPSRRSLGGDVGHTRSYHPKPPPSIAASDTSSAAGFRPSSRMQSNGGDYGSNPHRRMGSLSRSYAIDRDGGEYNGVNALYPRSTQDYMDELEYRGSVGGNDLASVTTSSPYSPRSADSSNYNNGHAPSSAVTTTPILKNGTLPRSHSRTGSAYGGGGTLTRGHSGGSRQSVNNYGEYANTDFGGGGPDVRPPSRLGPQANGSVISSAGSAASTVARYNRQQQHPVNGSAVRPNTNSLKRRSANLTANPLAAADSDELMMQFEEEENERLMSASSSSRTPAVTTTVPTPRLADFPTLPKRSNSTPVIATPHRPCCECNLFSKMTGRSPGGEGPNQPFPISFLFTVFLIFSLIVVSGIMLYLRGGTN